MPYKLQASTLPKSVLIGLEVALLLLFFHGTHLRKCFPRVLCLGFPGGPVVESPPANAGDTGSISGPERSYMPQGH